MSLDSCANACSKSIDNSKGTQCKFFSHSTNEFKIGKKTIEQGKCLLYNFKQKDDLKNTTEMENNKVLLANTVLYQRKD